MSAADDLKEYLDAVLGGTEGYLHTAVGVSPYVNEGGRYAHRRWTEKHYRWPEARSQAVADLLAAAEDSDAYVCPYVMVGDKRAQGAAAARTIVKADVDGGRYDPDKADELDAAAVGSGSDGNAHVYVLLAESVPFNQHEVLSRALVAYLDADAKISDNDVLRPPGTWNHKARVRVAGGEPTPVRWLRRPTGTRWEPTTFAQFLGVTLPTPAAAPAKGARAVAGATAVEGVDLDAWPAVRAAVETNTGDRSADTMRVVGACRDNGLTLAQTRGVVQSRADLAQRLTERRDDDVLSCWLKAVDSRQTRVAEVDVTALAPDTPEVIPAGGRYFNQAGLRAHTLMVDCERLGPLASGIDGKIWAYVDGVWIHGDRILRKRVVDLLGERYRRAHAETVESMALAREPFINDTPARDYLNVVNGLLDWRTGQLRPHTPEVPSTTRIPVRWNPGAVCPHIDGFLDMVVGPQCRPILEEVAGYALYPDQPLHKAVMLDGNGRNGKGTYLRILTALLGEANIAAAPPQRLDTDKWAVAQLYGKLANLVGDVDPRTFKETATFKQATGQDLLQGEHKYGAPFTFTSRALIVAAFNSLPRSVDTTEGFFSRWLVVPFPNRFADPDDNGQVPPGCLPKDPDLGEKVTSTHELEGFLVRAVAGLHRVMTSGQFTRAEAVTRAEAEFRRHADPVRGFLADQIIGDCDGWTSRAALHAAFREWATDNSIGILSAKRFAEKVREVHVEMFGYPASEAKRTGDRGWSGIRLRTAGDDQNDAPPAPTEGHKGHLGHLPLPPPPHTRGKGRERAPCAPSAPSTTEAVCCRSCGRTLTPAQEAHGYCFLAECTIAAKGAVTA